MSPSEAAVSGSRSIFVPRSEQPQHLGASVKWQQFDLLTTDTYRVNVMDADKHCIQWFEDLSSDDVAQVGGKNASLGEMIRALKGEGIRVPDGFATTAHAYRMFVAENGLADDITTHLNDLENGTASLQEAGKALRSLFLEASFPDDIADTIRASYRQLSERYETADVDVAVRSSATAEDLPEASFAGQQETYLNVCGEEELLEACKKCYASLFTDRAIAYREKHGFEHIEVALSIGIQKMVRADESGAGVLFTLDADTGFPDVVQISANWGLGETVVQGTVEPDHYSVYKGFLEQSLAPILDKKLGGKEKKTVYAQTDGLTTEEVDTTEEERRAFVLSVEEIRQLVRWGVIIEEHYDQPMDVEWAKDGQSGELFILQARPETVQSRVAAGTLKTYELKEEGTSILTGTSIGRAIASGPVRVLHDASEADTFEEGAILVTEMTNPDWVPIMRRAAGIVTNHGGRTAHAAIVSRELGIPAIVGTGRATEVLEDDQEITLCCADGDEGHVYEGLLDFDVNEIDLGDIPETKTRIMLNIGSPSAAMRWWKLPTQGVGLARMEYLINNVIRVHPMALVQFDELDDEAARQEIEELTWNYDDKTEYFVEHLARGIASIAAAQYPHPIIVRMSDFKTNEYADLIGGRQFEPEEENPMLGWRGASRYTSEEYREGFALECCALRRARDEMGFTNIKAMIPFCRTPEEADRVLEIMAEHGLESGRNDLEIYVMAELPSNIMEADAFAERFDGFSIGSNDLTQLALGVDRDSGKLAYLFDERSPTVKRMIKQLIDVAHDHGCSVGICGQAPSDHPEFAAFLVKAGIDSISLTPDSVMEAIQHVARAEKEEAVLVSASGSSVLETDGQQSRKNGENGAGVEALGS